VKRRSTHDARIARIASGARRPRAQPCCRADVAL
jgi:hypothetical protein